KSALKTYLGLTEPEAVPIKAPVEVLEAYAGQYESVMVKLDLRVEEEALVLQATPKGGFPRRDSPPMPTPPPVRLGLYAEDRAVGLDPPSKEARVEFLRNPDGSLAWLRIGGRVHARKP